MKVRNIETGKEYPGSSFRLVEGRIENIGELRFDKPIIPPNSTVEGRISFATEQGGTSHDGVDVYYGESQIEVRTTYYKSKK